MANTVAKLVVDLQAETARFRSDMNKATSALNNNVSKMKRSTEQLKQSFSGLTKGFKLFVAAMVASRLVDYGRQIVKLADSFNQLKGRVKNSLDSVNEFDGTFKKLIASSNRTGASLDTVSQAFVRLRPASQELGKTNDDLIRFNETFLKMGALAGATAEEVGNTMIQLSQGLASGALRGDELRSVMEQMPMVARTIADSMGIPFSEFKDAAQDGLVTAEAVFKAVIDQADETDIAFSKLPGSVDRAMTRISNSMSLLMDDLNQSIGLTDSLSASMQDLADSIEQYNIRNMDANTTTGQVNIIMAKLADTGKLLWGAIVDLYNTFDILFKILTNGHGIMESTIIVLDSIANVLQFVAYTAKTVTNAIYTLTDAFQNLFKLNIGGAMQSLRNGVNSQLAISQPMDQGFYFDALSIPSRSTKAARPTFASSLGGGDKKKKGRTRTGKSEVEKELDRLKSKAESLRESVRKPWEIMSEGIAEADKLLKMHLISMETYNRVIENLGKKTNDMIKVEGIDQALEAFMRPIEEGADSILEDFADGLDKVNEKADRQKEVLESIKTPLQQYNEQMINLAQLYNEGWINANEFNLAVEQLKRDSTKQLGDMESAIFSMGTAFEQSFLNFTKTGKFAFTDMINSMLNDLARLVFQMGVIQPLFGGSKANGGSGGLLTNLISKGVSSLFGGFGGSSVKMYDYSFGPAFANGGQTPANQPFLVGERGPEIMSFDRPGYVTPNHQLGGMSNGGGGVTVNQTINITTGVQATVRAEMARMMPEIKKQTEQGVMQSISRGGRMAKAVGAKA